LRKEANPMKSMLIVFKSGAVIDIPYNAKVYAEVRDNLGKDHVVENKRVKIATKNVEAIIFSITDSSAEEE
jgi:hypothetical protein